MKQRKINLKDDIMKLPFLKKKYDEIDLIIVVFALLAILIIAYHLSNKLINLK